MAAFATGGVSQSGLVERGHLDQLWKFDPLDQQLGDAVATPDRDRRRGVEVDQRDLDFAAITGVDRAGAVDDRKANARSQTGARVDQSDHAVRNRHGDAGGHQRALTGRQVDVLRAEQIHTRVAVVGAAGHWEIAVEANHRETGRHDAKTTLGRVSGSRVTSQTVRYRERLWVPWWWWPLGLALAALIAKEVTMGVRTLPEWLPYAVLGAVAVGVLLWMSRTEVRVVTGGENGDDVELWAGQAHLPTSVVSRSAEIPPTAKSAALGRQLDPAAFVLHRGWVGPLVLVVLDDPDDPTPYWLVSARHPDRVLSALRS